MPWTVNRACRSRPLSQSIDKLRAEPCPKESQVEDEPIVVEAVLVEAKARATPFGPEVVLAMTFPPGELAKLRALLNG